MMFELLEMVVMSYISEQGTGKLLSNSASELVLQTYPYLLLCDTMELNIKQALAVRNQRSYSTYKVFPH